MQTISVAEARDRFDELIDRVATDPDYTLITRGDDDGAVVMSLAAFNSLMETVHLLGSPANAEHLARSIAEYRRGEAEPHALLDD
jgi:antitoxin YefM